MSDRQPSLSGSENIGDRFREMELRAQRAYAEWCMKRHLPVLSAESLDRYLKEVDGGR